MRDWACYRLLMNQSMTLFQKCFQWYETSSQPGWWWQGLWRLHHKRHQRYCAGFGQSRRKHSPGPPRRLLAPWSTAGRAFGLDQGLFRGNAVKPAPFCYQDAASDQLLAAFHQVFDQHVVFPDPGDWQVERCRKASFFEVAQDLFIAFLAVG